MKNQKGYTLAELITVIFGLTTLALIGTGLYALGHFIAKFW